MSRNVCQRHPSPSSDALARALLDHLQTPRRLDDLEDILHSIEQRQVKHQELVEEVQVTLAQIHQTLLEMTNGRGANKGSKPQPRLP